MNNLSDSNPSRTEARGAPALLFEMMRSFVMLAKTLNLSQAVEELGSTRQTVRRHVSQLEEAMGCKLFDVKDRRYSLTAKGADAVGPAQLLLDQGNVWYQGQVTYQGGMPQYKIDFPGGGNFYQQQKPLGLIWTDDRPLLSAVLRAWTLSKGALEDAHFDVVRRYVMVFRNSPNGWVCTELGDDSSYVTWFGLANARSSIGRVLGELPGGPEFGRLLSEPFKEVEAVAFGSITFLRRSLALREGFPSRSATHGCCWARAFPTALSRWCLLWTDTTISRSQVRPTCLWHPSW